MCENVKSFGQLFFLLSEDQFGFRMNMDTRETILALRTIIEKLIRKDKPTYIAFVDIEKAFDKVTYNNRLL